MVNLCNPPDIELYASNDLLQTASPSGEDTGVLMRCLLTLILWVGIGGSLGKSKTKGGDVEKQAQIEDYPKGYPRFSALMAAHDSFIVLRRFSNLRVRLLLLRQDRLAFLEKKLDAIDREETSPLFLACSRKDKNTERKSVVSEIEDVLAVYDDLMKRSRRVLAFDSPESQHVMSLRNWLKGNGCIAREETEFLDRDIDLLTVSSPDDGIVSWLERFVFSSLIFFGKHPPSNISRDSRVHIFPRSYINQVARTLLTPFIIFLLLAPVIICNVFGSLTARLVIVVTATSLFVSALSILTKSKTVDLAVAGATYSTVLIVFIAGPGNPST